MEIRNWLGGKKKPHGGGSSRRMAPVFERLEPRLLLSANPSGLQLDPLSIDQFDAGVIEFDLNNQEEV
jgi:hypothetical protein